MDLKNLISFGDFTNELPKNIQKKTKRTEVGIDILNEHFFDKLAFKIKSDKPLEKTLTEFENRIIKAAKSGQINNLKINDNVYQFNVLNRTFKIECGSKCKVLISTPKMVKDKEKYSVNFEISKTMANNITKELDKIEY